MDSNIKDKYAKSLYNDMKHISSGDMEVSDVIEITISLLQLAEDIKELNGVERKEIVIDVLKLFVIERVDDEKKEKHILLYIDMFLPTLIDTFVALDKSKINIHVKQSLSKCMPCW